MGGIAVYSHIDASKVVLPRPFDCGQTHDYWLLSPEED
jgi:hypothetical protein